MANAWANAWAGFINWGAAQGTASVGTYGPPFADFQLAMTTTIDFQDKLKRDVICAFPTTRIDVDA